MKRLPLTMAAFTFAVAVNTASVAVQHREHLLTRRFGRAGWFLHLALVAPGYLWFGGLLRTTLPPILPGTASAGP